MRFDAHRRQMRRTHISVYRGEEHDGERRARGLDLEDRRGPDFLLQPARAFDAGRRQHDRERLLQGGLQGIADGICCRSAETFRRESGRQRGLESSSSSNFDYEHEEEDEDEYLPNEQTYS